MTRQFDENFKSILSSVKDKFSNLPNAIKKSPVAWAAIIMFIIGTSTGSFKTKIYNELNKKGGDVSKDEVVEVIRNLYVSNNQTVPADVEERIESVTKPSTPAVKTKAGPFVMVPPSSTTECNWPIVPSIARVESADQWMYNYLVSTGKFTPMLAAAIIGNIYVESKFDPTTKQIAKYNKGGPPIYGPGRGLIQWEKGGRYDKDPINLVSFAKKNSLSWNSLEAQAMFIVHEFTANPTYRSLRDKINNKANTDKNFNLEDCVEVVCIKYEKAGVAHMYNRIKAAQQFVNTNSLNRFVEEKR
jgi:hypothetical protein